ncbi:8-amino-7-oxononanoate synthase [Amylibacter marinus]|uniref:8-amino-7-oxononanoate synthase n=1 Tax=Amylibacter marinus TaxID=1475483 RepID=A0ABQ5VX35_9RHOB|nr:8-amino-7-oxononanoate synthase [Amylibacter marinus]GLQ35796.1 8-amino-7-oxononanoate synthase [Amylibacter marinus]
MSGFAVYQDRLDLLAAKGRLRALIPAGGVDFASNDYLGFSQNADLRAHVADAVARGVGLGAGGSRLLRGNDPEHEALETEAAAFFGTERALYMGGGFMANMALFSTLPRGDDLVLYDELIHASAHEGMRLGRASCQAFDHNDIDHADSLIKAWRAGGGRGRIWLAFESVYSMDGDRAPIADLVDLAARYDAALVGDEAHASGIFGDAGRGLLQAYEGQVDMVSLHTCGKALGGMGGLICGDTALIDTLINRARSFIFATAPAPINAATVRGALKLLQSSDAPSAQLLDHVAFAQDILRDTCGIVGSDSQIIPVIIGADQPTMDIAARLQARGFDIRGIRPPTVARGTSRLRISITLNASRTDITAMANALAQELQGITHGQ